MKDHRIIGKELDLFSFHDEALGSVFWHPRGWIVYQSLQNFIRNKLIGYQEISTPVLIKSNLFEQSGHLTHYKDSMFEVKVDALQYYLKPMNCPASTLVYKSKTRSYKDLPLRFSEFGILYRNELSGVLGGLFRLRQFTQDDAHIYVTEAQMISEVEVLLILMKKIYSLFGFKPQLYFCSKPQKAMGTDHLWAKAETALLQVLVEEGAEEKKGDGAFYGPKIDIHIKDSQKRDWQLGTIQLDFQTPERMGLEYVDKEGKTQRPIMIHRAFLGSLERFIGILLEHTQGNLPDFLSPVSTIIIPVADRHIEYARKVATETYGGQVEVDERSLPVSRKVRDAKVLKIPNIVVVGDKEMGGDQT